VADTTYPGSEPFTDDASTPSSFANAGARAREGAAKLGQKAASAVDNGRSGAARGIHGTAESIRSASEYLPGGPSVRQFAGQAADTLDSTADYVRDTDATEMLEDLKEQARSNPLPFVVGALAVGFLVGRMMRRG
jgi:hypothetical protein